MIKLIGVLLLFATSAKAGIFGIDDRMAVNPAMHKYQLARATAVAVLNPMIEKTEAGKTRIIVERLDGFLCRDERFANDVYMPYGCSGFLVAPDLLVTAGHCSVNHGETRNERAMYCEAYSWLFDFFGGGNVENVSDDRLYRCKQIIYAVRDQDAPYRDYALIQLDRPVVGRTPLTLAQAEVRDADIFSMIGYPLGSPAKLSQGARMLLNDRQRESFLTNLDAFGGNSGSAVFNARNEVVGILIAGTPINGFYNDAKAGCQRLNRCDSRGLNCNDDSGDFSKIPGFQGPGSEVQRIAPIIQLIREFEASR